MGSQDVLNNTTQQGNANNKASQILTGNLRLAFDASMPNWSLEMSTELLVEPRNRGMPDLNTRRRNQ